MQNYVVAWDPSGDYWEGAIVDEVRSRQLAARGVVTLPCHPEIFQLAGFAGYARRSWGSGWPLDNAVPQACCKLALFAPGEPYRKVHWAARLVAESTSDQHVGLLRLAATEAYWNQHRAVLSEFTGSTNVVDLSKIGPADEHGGWIVRGNARFDAPIPGFYGMGLYGNGFGMRVAWLAVTLTS